MHISLMALGPVCGMDSVCGQLVAQHAAGTNREQSNSSVTGYCDSCVPACSAVRDASALDKLQKV